MKKVLFLHMGPGFNSYPERRIIGPSSPSVDFWDQPPITTPTHSFDELVRAIQSKIRDMSNNLQSPIEVIAHSFGGHLITHALKEVGNLVSKCDFVATGYDLPGGFYKLLKCLGTDDQTSMELKAEIVAYLKSHEDGARPEEIWNYFALIVKDPTFMRLYWPSDILFKKHSAIAAQGPQIDAATLQFVLSDFLKSTWTPQPKPSSWPGPIKISLGGKDPLLEIHREKEAWKRIYPQAEIKIQNNSGHYLHLEDALNNF